MNGVDAAVNSIAYPVAIRDKELQQELALVVELYEMCTVCGERFAIGYRFPDHLARHECQSEELPEKLKQILSKDHRQNRKHKHLIELDY